MDKAGWVQRYHTIGYYTKRACCTSSGVSVRLVDWSPNEYAHMHAMYVPVCMCMCVCMHVCLWRCVLITVCVSHSTHHYLNNTVPSHKIQGIP